MNTNEALKWAGLAESAPLRGTNIESLKTLFSTLKETIAQAESAVANQDEKKLSAALNIIVKSANILQKRVL